jgi:hypothetical protein
MDADVDEVIQKRLRKHILSELAFVMAVNREQLLKRSSLSALIRGLGFASK